MRQIRTPPPKQGPEPANPIIPIPKAGQAAR